MKRRDLIKAALAVGGGLLLKPKAMLGAVRKRMLARTWAQDYSTSPALRKFIQPINGLGPAGIPVASPTTDPNPIAGATYDFYQMEVGEYTQLMHPDLPKATKLWGYADIANPSSGGHRYLGGVIVAQAGRPVKMTVTNNLPGVHPLPVDTSIMGAEMGPNRVVTHLHGGLVPWTVDGGPFAWFAPNGEHGPSFMNPGPKPGQADFFYPNEQSGRLLWYHDHALGTTRLNAYAGIASAYIIRDGIETAMIDAGVIPSAEVPLVIQDKSFKLIDDAWGSAGDLWYPSFYDPGKWELGPHQQLPPVPSCVPEFFADTVVVNGAVSPFLDVQPQAYRFRILNACQARFLNIQLYYANSSGMNADLGKAGPAFIQIGTEGGFLDAPVVLNNPPRRIGFDTNTGNANSFTLLLAPAERADVIIDFSQVPVGSKLILYSDSPAPFPMGDPINDHSGLDRGPDTSSLLQFRVVAPKGAMQTLRMPAALNALKKWMTISARESRSAGPRSVTSSNSLLPLVDNIRELTLNEDFDAFGRLLQRCGTTKRPYLGAETFARNYIDDPTEVVSPGSTEIWRIFNLTADTHPIHFHLVNARVLFRQAFDASNFNGIPELLGEARQPDPNEKGWKETIRMDPGEMTEVIMKFDLPTVPFNVPDSPRTGGAEYVWHCHILEHEEHDMMRPLIIK
jgi:spore coat protein A